MSYLCLYHRNCTDGTGAAHAVKTWLWERNELDNAEFKTIQYGEAAPDVAGLDVFIVDFSFPPDVLRPMADSAKSLVMIDHHVSAQKDYGAPTVTPYPENTTIIFDMDKAGCILTWEYLFPKTPAPGLFYYLQDRDLWQWKLPQSKEVSAALRSYKPFFNVWDEFMTIAGLEKLKSEGTAILRYQEQQIGAALSQKMEYVSIGGFVVPCANCTHLISEIGNEMAKGQPFAALYFDTVDKRVFSLRSTDEGVDVAEIAKKYGGGGHRNAAGFTVKKPPVLE
jgi:oligoribonuclease NrnB/cAMP/cGMP phosphodiesterase (DHH superfamily)